MFILFCPVRMLRNFSGTIETHSDHISRGENGHKGTARGKTSLQGNGIPSLNRTGANAPRKR